MRSRQPTAAPTRRSDHGAAAVEFALLLPIFVVLAVGTLSAGIIFFDNITITQASRDAARYGSTLPLATTTVLPTPTGTDSATPPGVFVDDWLNQVHDLAKTQAWGSASTDITTDANGQGYICVAYVRASPTPSVGMGTRSKYSGVPRSYPTSSTAPCFDDGRTDNRVQVLVRKDGSLNGGFINKKWELVSKGDIPYERTAP
jgi:Flp pilus assembly protein TadG